MGRAKVIVRTCQWCGKRLPAGRKSYCNNVCQGRGYARDAAKAGSGPVPPTPYKPKARKIILSDEQQRLARGYDHAYLLDPECRQMVGVAASVVAGDGRLAVALDGADRSSVEFCRH